MKDDGATDGAATDDAATDDAATDDAATDGRGPTVRRAGPGDGDEVFALARMLAITFPIDREGFDRGLDHIAVTPGAHLLVADVEGRVGGYLLGFVHPTFYANGPVAWVEELAVHEALRRRGIGALLTAAFEDSARAGGARLVALATTRAGAFYEAIGYARHAEYFRKHLPAPGEPRWNT